ncbi:MAG: DinB family protein [Myxococcota bacterium]
MNEWQRFSALYRAKVEHTLETVAGIADTHWDVSLPGSAPVSLTVSGIVRHLLTAERFWFGQIAAEGCDEATAPPAPDPALEQLAPEALIAAYRQALAESVERLASLPEARLHVDLRFVGRRFTTQAFCWTVLAHHAFHLGHIDLLIRAHGKPGVHFQPWGDVGQLVA